MEGIAHGVHIGPGFDQDSSSSSRAPPNAAVAAALSVVQQDNALSRRAKDLASSFGAGASRVDKTKPGTGYKGLSTTEG